MGVMEEHDVEEIGSQNHVKEKEWEKKKFEKRMTLNSTCMLLLEVEEQDILVIVLDELWEVLDISETEKVHMEINMVDEVEGIKQQMDKNKEGTNNQYQEYINWNLEILEKKDVETIQ